MTGNVPAWPVEADDKTDCNRVSTGTKDDRNGRGRCLRRQGCDGVEGYDHGYAAADEIGCERRQSIILILRISILDRNVLALNVTGLRQALSKRWKTLPAFH